MFKNFFLRIIQTLFKKDTQTTERNVRDNDKYAKDYKNIKGINFNAIFSNKLANYVVTDSELVIDGDNARVDLLNKTGQSMWKKMKKITSMGFGYGGVAIVPYVQGGKLYYNLVPQNRITIDKTNGELITGATILAEIKKITNSYREDIYYRWTNYSIENNNITMVQQYTDRDGNRIEAPEFWRNIPDTLIFSGVDRVLFGFIKSPINNRKAHDDYGVPIMYGCDDTILEILECMEQIQREYKLKETFVGADVTMFNGENALPKNGLYRKIDAGDDNFFEVFDPQFRSYNDRLQELYKRLEHEVGTSAGIVSEVETQNATATEIKRAMYDTFVIVDSMRSNIEKGMEDFFYSCNVLANVYNLSPQGDYELGYNWSYSLLEDTQQEFNQLIQGINQGVIEKVELRQWLKPTETIEQAEEKIKEIEENEPTAEEILGGGNNE